MVETTLQRCLDDCHSILSSVKEPRPGGLEGRLRFDHVSCYLMPRWWGRRSSGREDMGRCDRVVTRLRLGLWLQVSREVRICVHRGIECARVCGLICGWLLRPSPVVSIVLNLRHPTDGQIASERRHR
jgi:hypothetical protein